MLRHFFDFLEKYRELEPVYQATGKNSTPYDEYTERPYDDGRFSLKERVLIGNDIRYDMPMYNEKKKIAVERNPKKVFSGL